MSRLIRNFTVCLVDSFFVPIIAIFIKQCRCPNLPDVRSYLTLPYKVIITIFKSKPLGILINSGFENAR